MLIAVFSLSTSFCFCSLVFLLVACFSLMLCILPVAYYLCLSLCSFPFLFIYCSARRSSFSLLVSLPDYVSSARRTFLSLSIYFHFVVCYSLASLCLCLFLLISLFGHRSFLSLLIYLSLSLLCRWLADSSPTTQKFRSPKKAFRHLCEHPDFKAILKLF